MSAAPQRRYSAALIAAAAHQLGSGEVELTQWRELHALLLLADNQAAAVRLEQLFNTPPAESALLAAQRAELLAALAVQPLGGQHQQSRSALAQPLRAQDSVLTPSLLAQTQAALVALPPLVPWALLGALPLVPGQQAEPSGVTSS